MFPAVPYTFGFGSPGAISIFPHLGKAGYRADDLNYVSTVSQSPHVIVVSSESRFRRLDDLIGAARRSPGKLNFGSAGNGTGTHLVGELFEQQAGIDTVHVPYKGAAPAITALLGGEIDFLPADISAVLSQPSRLRVLAVFGKTRSPQLPDTPTTAELGLPQAVSSSSYGIIGPTGVPAGIIAKMQHAIEVSLQSPEVKDKLAAQGQLAVASTPAQCRRQSLADSEKWLAVIRKGNLKIE